jgi:selenide,water dikinase
MVVASGAGIAIDTTRLPFLPDARALADAGHFSGGMKRNRRYVEALFGSRLEVAADVPAVVVSLVMEAETSGGLLFSVRPERAAGVRNAFRAASEEVWEIGEVLTEPVLRLRA